MGKQTLLLFALVFISCNSGTRSKELRIDSALEKRLIGFYEFESQNGQRNQYILIDTVNNKYYGIYYRTEPKRGKGQWYYANSLSDIRIEGDSIFFVLGNRKLFNSKPVIPGKMTIKTPVKDERTGMDELLFAGRILNTSLQLICSSANGGCPEALMKFKKIPLPE